jgi:hypothetical protein
LSSLTWGKPADIASSPTKPEHAEFSAVQLTTRKSGKLQYMYREKRVRAWRGCDKKVRYWKGSDIEREGLNGLFFVLT